MSVLPPPNTAEVIDFRESHRLDTGMLLRQAYDRLEKRAAKMEAALLTLRDAAIKVSPSGMQGMPWVQAVDIINEALTE